MKFPIKLINVLGQNYTLSFDTPEDDEILKSADGYTDTTTKDIIIKQMSPEYDSVKDIEQYRKQVIRHELVHAFLFEAGLSSSSQADNEEIVDWIAIQSEKMHKAFEDAQAI